MRIVFDTNVLVSALLLAEPVPRRAFDRALHQGKVLLSLDVLTELNEVLGCKQFRKYVDEEDARRFLAALTRDPEWVEVATRLSVCRDPKDNKILELAVSGRATHLVSGDEDLLSLTPFQGIPILTPRAFLELPLRGALRLSPLLVRILNRQSPIVNPAFGSQFPVPGSQFPVPGSQFPIPGSRFPVPDSRFPRPFPVTCSLFPRSSPLALTGC